MSGDQVRFAEFDGKALRSSSEPRAGSGKMGGVRERKARLNTGVKIFLCFVCFSFF